MNSPSSAVTAFTVPPKWQEQSTFYNFVPRTSRNIIDRQRLIDRLENPANTALTLIVAPAGFGKTTLLTSWIKKSPSTVAWFSVEERVSSLYSFAFYIVAAFRQQLYAAVPEFGNIWQSAVDQRKSNDWKLLASVIIQELHRVTTPTTLIIDDYQFIADENINKFVAELIEKLPESTTVIISSRKTPALPLSRLRARGLLREIHPEVLRFTRKESSEFLQSIMRVDMSADDLDLLCNYTEGWIVGLQLAAISVQDGASVASLVRGPHRHSLVFLLEEVLERQSEEVKSFLTKSAVLERMNVDICNRMIGISDSLQKLNKLRAENLFIIALDDNEEWFRYHHLFRTLLLEQLDCGDPDIIRELRKRACVWFQEHDLLPDAVAFAVSGRDWGKVVELITPVIAPLLLQTREYREWLKALPPEAFESQSTLAVFLAWSKLIDGNVRGCSRLLDSLEHQISQGDSTYIQLVLMRMTIGWHALDFNSGMSYESIALHLTENDPANRYIVLGSMGYLQMTVGHPLQAEPLLREAVELARQSGNAHAELAMMFAVSIARNLIPNGRINQALSMLTQFAVDAEVNGVRIPGTSNIAIANVSIDRHDLKTAEKELDIARASIRRSGIEFASTFYWQAMINLRLAQNNLGAANSLSIDMADWCKRNGNDGWLRTAQTLNAYVQLERGQTEDIGRWLLAILDLSAIDIEFRDEPRYLLFARWALIKAVNDNDDTYVTNAAAFTERIAEQATQDGRVLDAGIANVLFAALLTRLNRVDDALMLLDKTAAVLLPESVIRPFLVYASSILACFSASNLSLAHYPGLVDVKRIIEEHTDTDIANRPTPADQLQILSEREQEVLNLLAMGMINSEIADSLVVSLNTVKTHIKNIYFKLDAHSRTQVIGRARDYNLL